ncbi:MAG: T9SS type A sorting domain-containing protein, partial [Flavobacteriaceae bacterium]|nr:T9SS type A sorting domain-containing protein [Flavobacteriaceae bacterium]
AWDYLDGWAYRKDSQSPSTTFNSADWDFSGANALDGCDLVDDTGTNAGCASVFPIGTFTYGGTPCGISLGTATYTCTSNTIGDGNDTVTVEIPYTGSDSTITSVTTTAQGGTVGGDDPATVADGTITITGLVESEAWDITINDGNCDGTTVSGTIPAAECDPTPSTCYDLSGGPEQFETVAVTPNNGFANNGMWSFTGGTYSVNAYCGSGCDEPVETWLILGPLDMTGVTDLSLIFDAAENFTQTDLVVAYTDSYMDCPTGSSWTTVQTLSTSGNYSIDLSAASGTDVFIGIQYIDDAGYSDWDLTNVELAAFGNCPVLGTPPASNCAVCDLALGTEAYNCQSNTTGNDNDTVIVEIPYTGSENTITSLSTTVQGVTIGGDDPTTVADGTITLSGLSEGDAWDLTINGGDCDGTTVSGTVPSAICDPVTMDLVINEIHADPDSTNGDANGDGTANFSDDEFVELFNIGSTPLDISGYTIEDAASVRHTFPASTILPANSFITVFGGGTPTGFSGLTQVASSGSVGLNNSGDTVTVRNSSGSEVVAYTYGSEGGSNQSIAREPDFTGAFIQHLSHTTNPVIFTPDSKNDGTTLSINDFDNQLFNLYPNPTTTGYVNIISNSSDGIQAQVFDILGKQVINNTVSNNRLNVSVLNAGIYIVKLTQNEATITKKLVIK